MPNFFVKWKGRESGPFSGEEIRGMFETGKIGLLHEIRVDGESGWTLLKDFDFSAESAGEGGAKKAASDDLQYAAYFLCGASFLHPLIFLASAALCVYAYKRRSAGWALGALAASSVSCLAGIAFFKAVYPVLAGS